MLRLFVSAHRAYANININFRPAAAAVHSVSPGAHHPVSPSSGRSHSTVLVHVFLGLPRFLFPLGAQVNRATCGFRFGAIRGTCPLPSPASYLFTDLFDPRSSPYFIVGYTYGPMDFQDSFEACVKKVWALGSTHASSSLPDSSQSRVNCNARTTCTNSSGVKPDLGERSGSAVKNKL
ncbi:hypothetical protein P5673_010861 [Acropora cervicornis]|uniref:Uncharacterized protein n=1 Tax=Acropora cervicornis TaxID=6130 RepID=A0AAD9QQQ4_ACRCE|nr:hypothetical protein P5673_010861 [Acropora cervicornis]